MAKEPRIPVDPFEQPSPVGRLWRRLFGAPRDVQDPSIFHKISLMAFLAWIGLVLASHADPEVSRTLAQIQRDLFAVGAQLADPAKKIAGRVIKAFLTSSCAKRGLLIVISGRSCNETSVRC